MLTDRSRFQRRQMGRPLVAAALLAAAGSIAVARAEATSAAGPQIKLDRRWDVGESCLPSADLNRLFSVFTTKRKLEVLAFFARSDTCGRTSDDKNVKDETNGWIYVYWGSKSEEQVKKKLPDGLKTSTLQHLKPGESYPRKGEPAAGSQRDGDGRLSAIIQLANEQRAVRIEAKGEVDKMELGVSMTDTDDMEGDLALEIRLFNNKVPTCTASLKLRSGKQTDTSVPLDCLPTEAPRAGAP